MDNIGEMDKFLEMHNLPRLNQEEIENVNILTTSDKIEPKKKKKKPPNKQKSRTRWLHR